MGSACRSLERNWPPGATQMDKLKIISEWCNEHTVFQLLPRYGFQGNENGMMEINNVINVTAGRRKDVQQNQLRIQKLVTGSFDKHRLKMTEPGLKSDAGNDGEG